MEENMGQKLRRWLMDTIRNDIENTIQSPACACCGAPCSGEHYDICMRCGWEKDSVAESKTKPEGWRPELGQNHESLEDYRSKWVSDGKPFFGSWIFEDEELLREALEEGDWVRAIYEMWKSDRGEEEERDSL